MAATPEAKVKKQIRAALDAHGAYYAMPIGTGFGNSGVPDFLCCVNGRFFAIEAKAGNGKTTALQDMHIERIRKCGGAAVIINEQNVAQLPGMLTTMENLRWK